MRLKPAITLHRCADCVYWEPALTYFGEPTGQGGCRFSMARNRKGDLVRECDNFSPNSATQINLGYKRIFIITEEELNAVEDVFFCTLKEQDYARIYPLLLSVWQKLCPSEHEERYTKRVAAKLRRD